VSDQLFPVVGPGDTDQDFVHGHPIDSPDDFAGHPKVTRQISPGETLIRLTVIRPFSESLAAFAVLFNVGEGCA